MPSANDRSGDSPPGNRKYAKATFPVAFEAPEIVLNEQQIEESIEHVERVLKCMRTLATIVDYYTYACSDLADALRNYANIVDQRSSSQTKRKQSAASASHEDTNYARNLVRSECLSNAAAFWESYGVLNDNIRLSILKEYFHLNSEAWDFFRLHSEGDAQLAGFLEELNLRHPFSSGDGSEGVSAPVYLPGAEVPGENPARKDSRLTQQADPGRCPFPLSRLPKYTFTTPPSASYPRFHHNGPDTRLRCPSSDSARRIIANQVEEIRQETSHYWARKYDTRFRALEESLLKKFAIGTTFTGYKSMATALKQSGPWKGAAGVQQFASQLDFDFLDHSDGSDDASHHQSSNSPPKPIPTPEVLSEAAKVTAAKQQNMANQRQLDSFDSRHHEHDDGPNFDRPHVRSPYPSLSQFHQKDSHQPNSNMQTDHYRSNTLLQSEHDRSRNTDSANSYRYQNGSNMAGSTHDVSHFSHTPHERPHHQDSFNDMFSYCARLDENQILKGLLAAMDSLARAKDSGEKNLLVSTINFLLSSFSSAGPSLGLCVETNPDPGIKATPLTNDDILPKDAIPANTINNCGKNAPLESNGSHLPQLGGMSSDSDTNISIVADAGSNSELSGPHHNQKGAIRDSWIAETLARECEPHSKLGFHWVDSRKARDGEQLGNTTCVEDTIEQCQETRRHSMISLDGGARLKRTGKFKRYDSGQYEIISPLPTNSKWQPKDSVPEFLEDLLRNQERQDAIRRRSLSASLDDVFTKLGLGPPKDPNYVWNPATHHKAQKEIRTIRTNSQHRSWNDGAVPQRASPEKENTKPVHMEQIPRFEDLFYGFGIRSHLFNNPPVVSESGQDPNSWAFLQDHITQMEPHNWNETPKKN
ncbi:hypothetical protein K440DRAFT_661833 [Wilcoxina mikolae CBS 423.85]|nr:hypothetical protein K440DRAFT_661833 [Wilcoxina mikolae CBS 423.85]